MRLELPLPDLLNYLQQPARRPRVFPPQRVHVQRFRRRFASASLLSLPFGLF